MSDDAGVGQELRGVIETLRRRDQQYRLLAEQAADGVLLVGADGRIGDASPGAVGAARAPARRSSSSCRSRSWSRRTRRSTT